MRTFDEKQSISAFLAFSTTKVSLIHNSAKFQRDGNLEFKFSQIQCMVALYNSNNVVVKLAIICDTSNGSWDSKISLSILDIKHDLKPIQFIAKHAGIKLHQFEQVSRRGGSDSEYMYSLVKHTVANNSYDPERYFMNFKDLVPNGSKGGIVIFPNSTNIESNRDQFEIWRTRVVPIAKTGERKDRYQAYSVSFFYVNFVQYNVQRGLIPVTLKLFFDLMMSLYSKCFVDKLLAIHEEYYELCGFLANLTGYDVPIRDIKAMNQVKSTICVYTRKSIDGSLNQPKITSSVRPQIECIYNLPVLNGLEKVFFTNIVRRKERVSQGVFLGHHVKIMDVNGHAVNITMHSYEDFALHSQPDSDATLFFFLSSGLSDRHKVVSRFILNHHFRFMYLLTRDDSARTIFQPLNVGILKKELERKKLNYELEGHGVRLTGTTPEFDFVDDLLMSGKGKEGKNRLHRSVVHRYETMKKADGLLGIMVIVKRGEDGRYYKVK